jgi:hypothetical protein
MTFRVGSTCAAVAIALVSIMATSSARADDCDDIVGALKKYGERIMTRNATTPLAICAAMGEAVGIMRSVKVVADECFEEGKKRDDLMKGMEESAKTMETEIAKECK